MDCMLHSFIYSSLNFSNDEHRYLNRYLLFEVLVLKQTGKKEHIISPPHFKIMRNPETFFKESLSQFFTN